MKHGTRVRLVMVQSKTEDRAERHNDVRGTLLMYIQAGGSILIAPEQPGDSPKGLASSMIREISRTDDGATMIQTNNSLYKMTKIEESGAV
jgi:hypothetical protein